jgi:hypothetical protein
MTGGKSERDLMGGIYAMYYTGAAGSGHALMIIRNGVVAGADAVGGVLDGTYQEVGDGSLDVAVTLTVPPGVWLVTGAPVGQSPMSMPITVRLPSDFASGNSVQVNTPTGPVNVIFKRLRDVP